jgi:hypothetical protein
MPTRKKSTAKDPATGQEAAQLVALAKELLDCGKQLRSCSLVLDARRKSLRALAPSARVAATLKWRGNVSEFTAAGWAADHLVDLVDNLDLAIESLKGMPTDFAADVRRHVREEQVRARARQKKEEWRQRVAEAMLMARRLSAKDGNKPDPHLTRSPWPYHRRALEFLARIDPTYRPDLKELAALEKRREVEEASWDGRSTPPHMTIYHEHFGRFDYLDAPLNELRAELATWVRG